MNYKILFLSSLLGAASYLAADCIPCQIPDTSGLKIGPARGKRAQGLREQCEAINPGSTQKCSDKTTNDYLYSLHGTCINGCLDCECRVYTVS